MGERLCLAVGVMGNVASLLLYTAPILTFSRVIRKKSMEGYSCVPYVIALLNCLLYTWYGLPVVSNMWENFLVISINGLGILLEISFIVIYLWFTLGGKMKVAMIVTLVIVIFCTTSIISVFSFHDHHHRKLFVGSIGLVASVAMYGSPLVVVKQVILTRSVEFMPFYLSFFSLLASSLWMAYGLLSHDLFLAVPNMVGSPLSILQLMLYCKYRKQGIMEKPNKWDLEKNDERSKQLQLTIDERLHGNI
ncbi:bidirectional sugar transporter SWEET3-like [Carya illinoinensis]|uniref:bidirectional sugar transporter SWEET3-like n=1 Tax=Carya illinoinensis TaxID=32201 RepID=UPI001C7228C3|nr:bidirectional sugar transporter SWEET3-like [Carya illinoinensis]